MSEARSYSSTVVHDPDCRAQTAKADALAALAVPADTWLLRRFADALIEVGVVGDIIAAGGIPEDPVSPQVGDLIEDAQCYLAGGTADDIREDYLAGLEDDAATCLDRCLVRFTITVPSPAGP